MRAASAAVAAACAQLLLLQPRRRRPLEAAARRRPRADERAGGRVSRCLVGAVARAELDGWQSVNGADHGKWKKTARNRRQERIDSSEVVILDNRTQCRLIRSVVAVRHSFLEKFHRGKKKSLEWQVLNLSTPHYARASVIHCGCLWISGGAEPLYLDA